MNLDATPKPQKGQTTLPDQAREKKNRILRKSLRVRAVLTCSRQIPAKFPAPLYAVRRRRLFFRVVIFSPGRACHSATLVTCSVHTQRCVACVVGTTFRDHRLQGSDRSTCTLNTESRSGLCVLSRRCSTNDKWPLIKSIVFFISSIVE